MSARGIIALAVGAGIALAIAGCVTTPPQSAAPPTPLPSCTTDADLPSHELAASSAGYISYDLSANDIREPVTKFGGQPVWLEKPRWPVSHFDGTQMTFVGQVALDRFPGGTGKLAYLFVAADPQPVGGFFMGSIPETWDPFGGDNAVIIQPGGKDFVPVSPQGSGPTVESSDGSHFRDVYRATLTERDDPAYLEDDRLASLTENEWSAYADPTYKDKVGGTPIFVQSAEFPGCGEFSTLALQVSAPPFYLNLGDGGSGFMFLNDDASAGTWVTQSH